MRDRGIVSGRVDQSVFDGARKPIDTPALL